MSLVMSGWHPDTKVLPELLQEQEGEHGVRDEADARRKEALGEEDSGGGNIRSRETWPSCSRTAQPHCPSPP